MTSVDEKRTKVKSHNPKVFSASSLELKRENPEVIRQKEGEDGDRVYDSSIGRY